MFKPGDLVRLKVPGTHYHSSGIYIYTNEICIIRQKNYDLYEVYLGHPNYEAYVGWFASQEMVKLSNIELLSLV